MYKSENKTDKTMDKLIKDLIKTKNFDDDIQKLKSFNPRKDIYENEEAFVIELAVPGYSKKDIEISVEDSVLKVNGKRELANKETEEFASGFQLAKNLDLNGIEARTENGILSLKLPKAKKETLKIEIK